MAGCRTADDDRLDAYHCPLRIRQIACVALFLSLIFRSSDFGPHLCLDDCFATTILTQLTEITQFIFGQPLSPEDTSPPWRADAARPECGHCWRRPRDSEPPGHGAHPGPMCRAAENHSRNPSWPASLPWWSARETTPRRPRHPPAPVRRDRATGGRERGGRRARE